MYEADGDAVCGKDAACTRWTGAGVYEAAGDAVCGKDAACTRWTGAGVYEAAGDAVFGKDAAGRMAFPGGGAVYEAILGGCSCTGG